MDIISIILVILGLSLFEIVSSIDNAVINAEVLNTMSRKGRRWFLIWGILIAVFMVRGLLPWLIVWGTNPSLGFIGSLISTFSNDPGVAESINRSAPILFAGGGIFLVFLFFHWLFLDPKNFGLRGERFFFKNGAWFYAVVSVILCIVVWYALQVNPVMAFGAVVGSTAFFITHGFKQNAEKAQKAMLSGGKAKSDLSKILYLEVIDATFSIDGVLGAFAFTLSIPLILIGNGIGAFVLRELTVRNIERIKKYKYLKNGAMYAVFGLGAIMIAEAFGAHVPEWVSPIVMFAVIGYFFWKSKKAIKPR